MEHFGITSNILIPVRIGPDQRTEMINQLLFGEVFKVTERIGNWCKIQAELDGYCGWIMGTSFQGISEEEYNSIALSGKHFLRSLTKAVVEDKTKNDILLLPGSVISGIDKQTKKFSLGNNNYTLENLIQKKETNIREAIIETSLYFLEAPYLWGGRSLFSIDCSGLTQLSFLINGVKIKRDASQQAEEGNQVHFLNESQPGDLAFFDNERGAISHVGILLGEDKIIHASGKVRIDKIDFQGIINSETREYSHQLRLIKSII